MTQSNNVSYILRNEAGCNFYQIWEWANGAVVLKESAAYLLKKPFGIGKVQAALVGAPGSFTVETFTKMQNQFLGRLEFYYSSKTRYATLAYQGEFGKNYILNAGQITFGLYF